ncbi:hypothetical protein ZWY2020_043537 [Hordeum vulgare]|nr:hypothetical protein ZWY2020_043537 [Hordeum vulgare]
MARNPGCAVYIGNLDEKVSERVLYEILIQISGQDKASSNANVTVTPKMNPIPLPNPPQPMRFGDTPVSQHRVVSSRVAGYGASPNHSYDFFIPKHQVG